MVTESDRGPGKKREEVRGDGSKKREGQIMGRGGGTGGKAGAAIEKQQRKEITTMETEYRTTQFV